MATFIILAEKESRLEDKPCIKVQVEMRWLASRLSEMYQKQTYSVQLNKFK